MSGDIQPRPQARIDLASGKLDPKSFEDIQRMANMMLSTGMMPQGCDTLPKAILLVTKAFELGMPFTQVASGLMIVRNKPAVWGDAALGLITRSPECGGLEETFEGEGDKLMAVCKVIRIKLCIDGTYARIHTTRTFSVEDAKRASLWSKSGPWKDYPKRMLQMRARAFALRDSFPDLLNGLAIAEEVQDFPEDSRQVEQTRAADMTRVIQNLAIEPAEVSTTIVTPDASAFEQLGLDLAATQGDGK